MVVLKPSGGVSPCADDRADHAGGRVTLALGGKSAVIVCNDADIARAVDIAAMAVFATSGQVCIAGSRPSVARSIHDDFVQRVPDFASDLTIGQGIDADTDIGPIIPTLPFAMIDEVATPANATP